MSVRITIDDKDKVLKALLRKRIVFGACWRWAGELDSFGYGGIKINYIQYDVHRLSAYIFLGLDLKNKKQFSCHKPIICKYKDCWNPEHLYIGNSSSNTLDTVIVGNHPMARKTHCKNGHEYTPENTYIMPCGGRDCKFCIKERRKKHADNKNRSNITQSTKI